MTRVPTIDDIREIVNSPHLSDDVKRQVAKDYFDHVEEEDEEELYRLGFDSEDHMNDTHDWYSDKFDFGDLDQAFASGDDIFGEYEDAKKQHDAGVVAAQKTQEKAAEAKRTDATEQLADLRKKRSETEPGVTNSNDILDKGVEGAVHGLERFCPAYNRALGIAGTDLGPVSYERDVLQRYDEQRNIPFNVFRAQAEEIDKLREDLVESLSSQSNRLATVFSHWQGAAADSAQTMWRQVEKLSNSEVKESLSESSEAILRACSAVAAACQRKAEWSLKYAIPNWCGLQPYEIDMAIRIARSGRDATDAEIKHFMQHLPPEDQALINDDKGDLEDETKDAAEKMAQGWLQQFTSSFAKFVSDFHVMCDNEKNATDEAWGNLTRFLLGLPDDPYAAVAAGGAAAAAPASGPLAGAGGASGSAGGGPSFGGGSAGGGSAGIGGGPSGALGGAPGGSATQTMPSMPKPDMGPGDAMGQDAVNPITGKAMEIDPATENPYPINPETGEAIKDAAPDVDTVTVRKGESEIALTEPNRDGEMSVRIDNGTGAATEYKLDFGAGGTLVGEHAASGFGPTGAANGVPGGAAAMAGGGGAGDVHTPGKDGTIQIHEGELSIIAEQPLGPDGATVVTVDDGNGEPATYVMGDADAVREYNDRVGAGAPGTAPQAADTAASAGQSASGSLGTEPQQSGAVRPASVSAGDSGVTSVAGAFTEPSEPTGARGSLDGLDGVGAGISGSAGGDAQRGVGGSLGAELAGGPNAGPDAGHAGHAEGVAGHAGGHAGIAGGAAGFVDGAGDAAFGGDSPNEGPSDGPQSDGPRPESLRSDSPQTDGPRTGAIPTDGTAGVGSIPGESTSHPAPSGSAGVGGAGGAPMMGGAGAGAGGGGEDQQRTAAYPLHETDLFEPDVPEGPFGIARISGSLDDDEPAL